MKFNTKLRNSIDKVSIGKEKSQRLVGKLIYLYHTRPYISYRVSTMSQFMQAPYKEYLSYESYSAIFENYSKYRSEV